MKTFGKILLAFLVAIIVLWQLPWLAAFVGSKPSRHPFTVYSCMIQDFAMIDASGDELVYTDRQGRIYTEEQFDSILPLLYARQLFSEGRFPTEIHGRPIRFQEAMRHDFFFRSSPRDINKVKPGIYFLLESMSGRVDLEMPDDAFRINARGIEFIDMETNTLKPEKSRIFTEMMKSKGFVFPARQIAGNPTAQKEYDEGYLLSDAEGRLYHLKMMRGTPYFRQIPLPEDVHPEYLFLTEVEARDMLGLFTDTRNRLYAIRMPGYSVQAIDIPSFDPEKENLSILGNLLDWTLTISSSDSVRYYAVETSGFSSLGRYSYARERSRIHGLCFTSSTDSYVKPRFY